MVDKSQSSLQIEWTTLHAEHERYDQYALLIKLVTVVVAVILLGLQIALPIALVIIAVLWLQEGIWRTVQARAAQRIMVLEKAISQHDQQLAFQFYSNWQASRPGTVGMVKEYIANAVRPTVAYPYAILLMIVLFYSLYF